MVPKCVSRTRANFDAARPGACDGLRMYFGSLHRVLEKLAPCEVVPCVLSFTSALDHVTCEVVPCVLLSFTGAHDHVTCGRQSS